MSPNSPLINGLGGTVGFGENLLDRNDDRSTGFIDVTSVFESGLNFFGITYYGIYINNNGNITFSSPQSIYTPFALTGNTYQPIIAPFFADVDTRSTSVMLSAGGTSTGSNLVYWDLDTTSNRLIITWDDVGEFPEGTTPNAFQLLLTDTGFGNFDIEFRYEQIDWLVGSASGNTLARAGYSAGNGVNFFELSQSGTDTMANLETASNINQAGRYKFSVISGTPVVPGMLSFAANQFSVDEDGTPIAAVTIVRSEGSGGTVGAQIILQDGTANSINDYTNTSVSVTFAPGETSQTVYIPIVDDSLSESDETIHLLLTSPSGGATIGSTNTATLTIVDNDSTVLITGLPQGSTGSNKGSVTVAIAGQNFSPTDQFQLISPTGISRTANQTYWVNENEAWATFDLEGLSIGAYDVNVVQGPNSSTLNNSFTVTDGPLGNLNVQLQYPSQDIVSLEYRNAGQTDLVAPLLRVVPSNASIVFPEVDTSSATLRQLLNLVTATGDESPSGILSPGESGEMSLAFTPDGDGLISFKVEQVNPNELIDWARIKAESRVDYSFIDPAGWDAIWSNLTDSLGSTFGQFQAVMAENANYLSQLGQETNDLRRLFAFEWKQAANTLANTNDIKVTDVVDVAPGLSLTFNRTYHQSTAERYTLGSLGRGWASQWDLRATTNQKGDVLIRSIGDLQRSFERQADGTFLENGGARVNVVDGQYILTETSGLLSFFASDGTLSSVQDANGNRITLEYTTGQLSKLQHTNGDSLTISHNSQGRIDSITDSTGQITRYAYSSDGEYLLSVTAVDGIVSYSYDTGSLAATKHSLLSVSSDLGYQRHFEYDQQGRLNKEYSNGNNDVRFYSYDSVAGFTIRDHAGTMQTVLLDDRENIGQIRGVDNQNLRFDYDIDGNMTKVTLPSGGQIDYRYDLNGNLTGQENLLGQVTGFEYDPAFQQLAGFTDAKENGVEYRYDSKGNLNKIIYADGTSEQFTLDGLGKVIGYTNRRGASISYGYDNNGLLTNKQYADGTSVLYGYDARGNLSSCVDSTGTTTLLYDAANRIKRITYPTGRYLNYSYNSDGQRIQLSTSDGYVTNYSYDVVGRIQTLTNATGQVIVGYEYDQAGRLTKEINGNGTYTTYEYDLFDQLTRIVHAQADHTINSQYDYTYDRLGRRTSMTTREGLFQYEYDLSGQLISVVTPDNRTIRYAYDSAGNRVGVTDDGVTTSYTTNNLNQYTNIGNAICLYDADGNLLSKTQAGQTSTYAYDAENRLVRVSTPSGTWEYHYNGLGHRVATTNNGLRTDYLLDPTGLGDIIGEYSGTSLLANYTHGIGLVSSANGNSINYYDADAIGSITGLTGSDGTYVNQYSYLPFGEDLIKIEEIANPFEYVGQWGVMDEGNGLDFMRSRFYNSDIGRFSSLDSLGVNAGDANLYRYVFNDPISNNDPSGAIAPFIVAGAIGAGIGAVSDIAIQAASQYFSGQKIDINWTSVGVSASLGAFGGGLGAGLKNTTKVSGQVFSHWLPERWAKSLPTSFGNLFKQNHWLGRLNGQYVSKDFHYLTDYYATLKGLPKAAYWGQKQAERIGANLLPRTPLWLASGLLFPFFNAGTYNDPHINSLDGLGYDFQAVGEFTLLKSSTDDFEIQTRQQPWGSSTSASANTAIAIRSGGQRIAVYANQSNALRINGAPVSLPENGLYAVGQNLVTRSGNEYRIFTSSNDLIVVNNRGTWLNINLGLAESRKDKVVGLLGNFNERLDDELALRDGPIIGSSISDAQLYGDYAASWRITQETSLFDYGEGQSTISFTDLSFPRNIITTAALTAEQRATAEQIARDAGIADPDVLDDLILDIFLSNGDQSFIQEALNGGSAQQRIETINALNTLINTDGLGSQHLLSSSTVMPYVIRFANPNPAGTIPVAQVRISQTLDSDLDLSTFSFDDIGFGDIILNVPNGSQAFSQRLDLRGTRNIFVDVSASLNNSTRELTWLFTAIDPTTGQAVSPSTQGFLPPDDDDGAGQGFVGFSIQPQASSDNNTRIDAQASIGFNGQVPIQTNPVFNTIIANPPFSQVNALPSISEPRFAVNWIGSDSGAGIASYDIYVRTDGGVFTLWQNDVTITTATFAGEVGKSYAFYSVATDQLGLREAAPDVPDAITFAAVPTITLALTPAVVAEDGTSQLIYTFTRIGDATPTLEVLYTVGGTGTLGTDYTGIARKRTTKSVTFAAGASSATVTVDPTADTENESDETVELTLASGSGYTIGTAPAVVGTIGNDDFPVITLSCSPKVVTEDGTSQLIYTFTRTGDITSTLEVLYTAGGTATLGTDYTGIARKRATKSVTFAAGASTATVTVDPTADTENESDETVELTLASGSGYTIGTTPAVVGTISNDDFPVITLSCSPKVVTEDGTSQLIYTFTRTGDITSALEVLYSAAGTATLGTDYTGIARKRATKSVTFAAGASTATVTVDPTADTEIEGDETVELTLASGSVYTIGTTPAVVGTISNDDFPVITLSCSPKVVTEDDTSQLIYTFTRTGDATPTLEVLYTVGGTGTLGTDYTGIARKRATKSVTFAAGASTATVTVDPTADTEIEGDETVELTLASGSGYTIGTTPAVVGTISNDDFPVITLSCSPKVVTEDDTSQLIYTFTRTGDATPTLEVLYTVGGTATLGTDYTGIARKRATKSVTLSAGASTATVTVDATADTEIEGDETVELTLASGSGYTIGTTTAVVGTISNDDLPVITLDLSLSVVTEDSAIPLTFTFTRSGSTSSDLEVLYNVGGTATLGTDYTGIARKRVTKSVSFAAGSSIATVTVEPTADVDIEVHESVELSLATSAGYTIGTSHAFVGLIINDDVSSDTTYTLQLAESSLLLLGSDRIHGIGNELNNTITGNINNNRIVGMRGADLLTGGGSTDSDVFFYNSLDESLLGSGNAFDVITDYNPSDRIFVPMSVVSDRLTSSLGNVASLTETSVATLLTATTFAANAVAAFTASKRPGTLIAINDGRAGFQADSDAVILLQNYDLGAANFVEFV